jgi:hypothetical protein
LAITFTFKRFAASSVCHRNRIRFACFKFPCEAAEGDPWTIGVRITSDRRILSRHTVLEPCILSCVIPDFLLRHSDHARTWGAPLRNLLVRI